MDETPDAAGRAELTEQILGAEQDERRRIALFLHDGPVQSLSGIALMLDAVGDFLSRGSTEQAREILDKALSRTRTTIGELRDLSFTLEPVVLRDHGFGMAVNALAQEKGLAHKMKIELDIGAAEVLGERTQAALYQIVREALDGAIRRGPPRTFSVLIEPEQQTLAVTIRDDASERAAAAFDRGARGARSHARRSDLGRSRRARIHDAARAADVRRVQVGSARP